MLHDVRGRIRVPVGVAYGSDTALVKNLLLDVAQKNSSVISDGSLYDPKVLFIEFGDSALLFELRAFIKNIDQRFQVTSDLNYAIDSVFRENNIQIPFPQRDVHIINDSHNTSVPEPDKLKPGSDE
jgi:small-conductance mechanosensitive channel